MIIKKIWKLLSEDPSKAVKGIESPVEEKKEEPIKEEKKEIRKPSLGEQLSTLKQQSMYSSSGMPDFQVLDIYPSRDSFYRDSRIDHYHDSISRRRYPYDDDYTNECYNIKIKLSGSLLFRDSVDFYNIDRKGVINIGNEEIEKSTVDYIEIELTVEKSSYDPMNGNTPTNIELSRILVKRTLSDQSGIKTISKGSYSININPRNSIRSRFYDGYILHNIRDMFPFIKREVEENFREEVENTKYQIKIRESLKEFDSKINENSLRDCFAYALDEDEKSSISLRGIPDMNGRIYPGLNDLSKKYWEVIIAVSSERIDGGNQMIIDDKSSNILFEINEGINRLRKIYDKSKIVLNFSDYGNIKIHVFPILNLENTERKSILDKVLRDTSGSVGYLPDSESEYWR